MTSGGDWMLAEPGAGMPRDLDMGRPSAGAERRFTSAIARTVPTGGLLGAVMLELDHVFCVVDDLDHTAALLEQDGWVLDAGTVHTGQGTRNRRLLWPEHYLELLRVVDPSEAFANPLRLDRRAEWRSTGASPFGLVLRGQLADRQRQHFIAYDDLGPRLWVHRDNLEAPARPQVFVFETAEHELERRRPRSRRPRVLPPGRNGALQEVHVRGPEPARLPPQTGPMVLQVTGAHHLELVVGARPAWPITEILTIRG
ncbi:MAG: VOC family protein [Solirubrobacterales bacterium]|nr:VOC family protein [Solirubrobacterales bacterium]